MNKQFGGSRLYIAVGRIRQDSHSGCPDGIIEDLAGMLRRLRASDPHLCGMVLWDVGLIPRGDHIEVRYYFHREGDIPSFADEPSPALPLGTTSGTRSGIGA